MPWDLKGKTALVTGAAKRIGREIALELADEGANVVIHYMNAEKEASDLKTEVGKKGVKAWTIRADFQKGEYESLIDRAVKEAGPLDMLVNNASIFPRNKLNEITFDGLISNIKINAWAPFTLCRDFARASKAGKIVNMLDSRITGYDWTHVEYLLSKHVLAEMTRMMAVDYAPGVVVNGVSPGLILPPPGKDMSYLEKMDRTVPLKKHGGPRDIAGAVVYIFKSDFLCGEVINVDGGRHLLEYDNGPHPD